MLRKQLRFDLVIFRDNPIKYIVFILQVILIGLFGFYASTNQGIIFAAIQLVTILILFLFIVNISIIFEKQGLEYVVNKLAFYPTTKRINLISKAILLVIFVIFQMVLNCLAIYMWTFGSGFNAETFKSTNIFVLISGIFCFMSIWGIRSIRNLMTMSCFCIPIFFIVISNLNVSDIDMVDIVILSILFIFDLIVNIISYRLSNS